MTPGQPCAKARSAVRFTILALSLVLAAAETARGRDLLSLPDLIEDALHHNPALSASRTGVEAAAARVPQARALPDPMLMAGFMNVPADSFRLDRDPMTLTTVGVSQMLMYPGKLPGMGRAAEQARRAEEFRYRAMRQETAAMVRMAYYDIVYLDRAAEITAETKGLMEELVRSATAGYSAGMGLMQDPLKAQVEVSRMIDELIMFEMERQTMNAELNRLLGARPGKTAGPAGALPALGPAPSGEALREAAARDNPMVLMQRAMIEMAREELAVARLAPYPDPTVSLSYGARQRNGMGGAGMSDAGLISAEVSIPVPLWKKNKQDKLAAEREAELRAAEAQARETEDAVMAGIEAAWAKAEAARKQAVLIETATLPQAREALASSRAAYQTGRLEFMSVLDNQVKLYQQELRLARLWSDYHQARAELDRLAGRPVEDIVAELRGGGP